MTAQSNPWIFPIPVQDLPAGAWAWSKGRKNYEFKDHRSNVYVVVSDLKLGKDTNNDATQAEYYFADVQQAQENASKALYAFGMIMPGRNYDSPSYRYGYNGQEKDDEIKGSGNSYSFEYRVHDARLGRFLSVDPLSGEYPWNSSYAFAENRVIDAVELEGLESSKPTNILKDNIGLGNNPGALIYDNNGNLIYTNPVIDQINSVQRAQFGSDRYNVRVESTSDPNYAHVIIEDKMPGENQQGVSNDIVAGIITNVSIPSFTSPDSPGALNLLYSTPTSTIQHLNKWASYVTRTGLSNNVPAKNVFVGYSINYWNEKDAEKRDDYLFYLLCTYSLTSLDYSRDDRTVDVLNLRIGLPHLHGDGSDVGFPPDRPYYEIHLDIFPIKGKGDDHRMVVIGPESEQELRTYINSIAPNISVNPGNW